MYYLYKTEEFPFNFQGLKYGLGMGQKNKIGSREEWFAGGLEGWKWRGKEFTADARILDIILVIGSGGE